MAMKPPKKYWTRAVLPAALCLLLLLIGARLYLPHWVTGYVNRQIAALDGYGGGVRDIGISLWRGAYQIHGLEIHRTKGGLKTPFVSAGTIDLSVEWRALFKGRVVAEADVRDIDLNFAASQTGEGAGWAAFIDSLTPFEINRLTVTGGKVAYLDYGASPDVNIYIADVRGSITNLRNVDKKDEALPSTLELSGASIGGGAFILGGKVNILRDIPDFDIDMKLENAALTALNDYTRAAAAVDFEKGRASLYSELAAANGRVTGYLKVIATDVSVIGAKQDANPLNAVWEALVAGFMTIFKNQPRDQFALSIPIEGTLENPDKDAWSAFLSIFSNAFVKAFPRDTEGNVSFEDVMGGEGE